MDFFNFLLLSLATWRITYLLVDEEGPRKILLRMRSILENYTGVLGCVWCTSVWTGGLASLYSYFAFNLPEHSLPIYALAFSAMSIFITELLERVIKGKENEKSIWDIAFPD